MRQERSLKSGMPSVNDPGRRVPPNRKLRAPVPLSPRLAPGGGVANLKTLPDSLNLNLELLAAVATLTSDHDAHFDRLEQEILAAAYSCRSVEPLRVLTALHGKLEQLTGQLEQLHASGELEKSPPITEEISVAAQAHTLLLQVWQRQIDLDNPEWVVAFGV